MNKESVDGFNNTYEIQPDGSIKVSCINNKSFIIDIDDVSKVQQYLWHVNSRGYVISGSIKPNIRLHRFLLGLTKASDVFVDHISGDTTDNRRSNLRVCACRENSRNQVITSKNTSGFKGVSYWKRKRKFIAEIVYRDDDHGRHRVYLGSFDSAKQAAMVYDQAAVLYHGEFARTNYKLGLLDGAV